MTEVRRSVKIIFWGLVLGLTAIATALLGELAARWRERHRSTPPGTMLTAYYAKFRLRPALAHNQDYFGWARIDSLGLRGHDVSLIKPPGTTRILADGGSTTFDTAVSADDSTWPADTRGGWHHMGTTRMSDDPRQGVVDRNCRVHGIENLYVAGSSVFPTAGSGTPTLMLVSLALRLADHIKDVMR